jgi:GTP-binding protein
MPPKKPSTRIVSARYVASASSIDQMPAPVGVEIAFAGRSNVGKSSLLNAITKRRSLVRTSRTPGCTRQISFFEARLDDGALVTLVDLPGYGYAKRSKRERADWGELIEGFLLGRPTLKAVAILIDARRGPETEENDLLELLNQPPAVSRNPLETLIVATKLDKIPLAGRKLALQRIVSTMHRPVIGFSTQQPDLAPELVLRIRRAVGLEVTP